jgi:hypothetical protein
LIEDTLACLNLRFVAQTLQGSDCRHRHRRGLLEADVRRLQDNAAIFSRTYVLGHGTVPAAEDLIARFELRHISADRFDCTCVINTKTRVPRLAQPAQQSREIPAPYPVTIGRVNRVGAHFDQDLVVIRNRPFDDVEPEHIG